MSNRPRPLTHGAMRVIAAQLQREAGCSRGLAWQAARTVTSRMASAQAADALDGLDAQTCERTARYRLQAELREEAARVARVSRLQAAGFSTPDHFDAFAD